MIEITEIVGISLSSAKDFQDKKVVSSILGLINNSPFIPEFYGLCEPLKFKYKINDTSGPISVWMHEEVNKKLSRYDQAFGSLMMMAKKEEKGFYNFVWQKLKVNPKFNYAHFSVGIDYLNRNNYYDEFIDL
ncbi:MAG: hypothetical protein PHS84_14840 [Paludibacter sp.]|nr:hypothetical protein [Paludibacter sp.]